MKKTIVFPLAILLLAPFSAEAKTLYVNGSTGNDSTSYAANGPSTPWRTIGRAAWGSSNRATPNASQAAQAGDTVLIQAGTYNHTSATGINRFESLYHTANSGTAGNLITFSPTGGVVTIQSTVWSGPAIGAYQKNYISWDGLTPGGFYLDEDNINSKPDTGPVVLAATTGSVLKFLEINGKTTTFSDNHNGIRLEGSIRGLVSNNRIYDIRDSPSTNHNQAAIMLYDSIDNIIEHSELSGSGSGIYVKGDHGGGQRGNVFRYNLIYDVGKGIVAGPASQNSKIYQNIIRDTSYGLSIMSIGSGPTAHPINDIYANNTFDNNDHCVIFEGAMADWVNVRFWNNICHDSNTYAVAAEEVANPLDIDFEHNLYFMFPTFAFFGSNMSFATWKSSFGEDAVSPASLNSNPLFVNTAGNDFHVLSGSPARNAGIDILDLDNDGSTTDTIHLGPYVTGTEIIGRTSGIAPPPPTAPSAPTSLRIIP